MVLFSVSLSVRLRGFYTRAALTNLLKNLHVIKYVIPLDRVESAAHPFISHCRMKRLIDRYRDAGPRASNYHVSAILTSLKCMKQVKFYLFCALSTLICSVEFYLKFRCGVKP